MITASNEMITTRNEGNMVELTEGIPGTKLTYVMNEHTISKLKWWLLYHAVKALNELME